MKKTKLLLIISFIFLAILAGFLAFAQEEVNKDESITQTSITSNQGKLSEGVPHNILIELFLNDKCVVCPKAAYCLEELAWSYEQGRVILVESHIWNDGYDIPQTNTRYDWYAGSGIKGTPDAFFNGLAERVQGLCCDCGDIDKNITAYQSIIDKHLAQTSSIEIGAMMGIYSGKLIIQGSIASHSHSLLRNLTLSGMVYYEGDESEFFYLVKDIFEGQDICQLAPLEEREFSFVSHLDLIGVDDEELDRYYGVVFVQDKLTKEVLQSFLVY